MPQETTNNKLNDPSLPAESTDELTVAIIMLAAGSSKRFGTNDKLLADIDGKPVIFHTLEAVNSARTVTTLVVADTRNSELLELLDPLPITIARNKKACEGIGGSIAAGITALPEHVDGALILPADMPWMTAELLDHLIKVFKKEKGRKVIVPLAPTGEQRNPVIWPKRHFADLAQLKGDAGAKRLIPTSTADKLEVLHNSAKPFRDIDTPADLRT
ncbi:MAG: nucleotidyltransferase family protein [Filomicrobium sp.]